MEVAQYVVQDFVKKCMRLRDYFTKKSRNTVQFDEMLLQDTEKRMNDEPQKFFTFISRELGIPEDEVRQHLHQKCIEEHLRLCAEEAQPKVRTRTC